MNDTNLQEPRHSHLERISIGHFRSLVPLFQNESKCEAILMKMAFISMKMKLHAELIFTRMVSHLDSF